MVGLPAVPAPIVVAAAPPPAPEMVTVGGVRYPLPGLDIFIRLIPQVRSKVAPVPTPLVVTWATGLLVFAPAEIEPGLNNGYSSDGTCGNCSNL